MEKRMQSKSKCAKHIDHRKQYIYIYVSTEKNSVRRAKK